MFEKKLNDMLDSIERQRKMYVRGDELLFELGLNALEPLVRHTYIWQDSRYETDRSNPDFPTLDRVFKYSDDGCPYVHVTLLIRQEDKEAAREIILRDSSVERWEKRSRLSEGDTSRPHYYVEMWTWENGERPAGYDRVDVEFYRPVEVGDVVDGCAVERSVREISGVTLKCSLGDKND